MPSGTGNPVLFLTSFRTTVRNRAVLKESIMSAFWLLLVAVAGFGWHALRGVLCALPTSNEDFVFC